MKKNLNIILSFIFIFTLSIDSFSATQHKVREKIAATSKKYLGIKYNYGGTGTTGFDCSGFVMFVYNKNGIQLPRTAGAQYNFGKKIPVSKAKTGDLVFFNISGNRISHVGIYLGEGTFIHSPSTEKKIRISKIDNSYWKKKFAGAVVVIK